MAVDLGILAEERTVPAEVAIHLGVAHVGLVRSRLGVVDRRVVRSSLVTVRDN
jgi:hypothetical protein